MKVVVWVEAEVQLGEYVDTWDPEDLENDNQLADNINTLIEGDVVLHYTVMDEHRNELRKGSCLLRKPL